MKFFPLVWANLTRHKRRTALTTLSVALALFLFASLRSVVTTLRATGEVGSETRMIVQSAKAIVFFLPMSYRERLLAVPGVQAASWANWFGGVYQDPKNFFAQFAVDPESYLDVYAGDYDMPADQRAAFIRERTGCIVGKSLLDKFGWHLGQNVTLTGTIFEGDWPVTIRGVFRSLDPVFSEDAMLVHYDMVYERYPTWVRPGWYVLQLKNPALAPQVAAAIDSEFKNSSDPTKTGSERAFNASFVTMWGNVSFLMDSIGMAVVFAILLVAANSMMLSARERTNEVGVLKTVGFGDRLLFGLVMAEAGGIAAAGAVLGLGAATVLWPAIHFSAMGFLPGFRVTPGTLALGLGIAVLLAVASGLLPALSAARLSAVQALRHVE
ncbi:MAG TPA: FtsX-like permease family protein [Gemmatimonadales bacterium]|nr:FtsX-like permease family protein [Gemmatimonadales bacterium]